VTHGLRRSGDVGRSFCTAFITYVVIGGLLGLALAQNNPPQSCWPTYGLFWTIHATCQDPLAQALWHWGVSVPRGFVVTPAVTSFGVWLLGNNSFDAYATTIFIGLVYGVPALVMAWIGLRYWHAHSRVAAWVVGLAYAAQVLALAKELIFPSGLS
jgi:hypothetical protein